MDKYISNFGTSIKECFAGNPRLNYEQKYYFSLGAHFAVKQIEDMVKCLTKNEDVAAYVLTLLNKIKEE